MRQRRGRAIPAAYAQHRREQSSPRVLADPAHDVHVVREALAAGPAVDHFPIDADLVDPLLALDKFSVDAELLLDGGRQTGGLREVVSLHAIGDSDLHGRAPAFGGELAGMTRCMIHHRHVE